MVRLCRLIKSQKGATLVELLATIVIASVISILVSTLVIQIINVNAANSSRMSAVKQVENALHYLNRDIQMASPMQTQLPTSGTFPLTLKWTDYLDNNNEHIVTYAISDGKLQRTETVAGTEQSFIIVANCVDAAITGYTFDGEVVTISLTVTVDGFKPATETRIFESKLRPSS